ncbi:MAG: cob(I)yrinic acid a,c-diamide adenosyltransferase [Chitinophagaceae bacterium]
MKIYTRQGDKGTTSLADATNVPKDDPKIEAIGTIDELNCWIGLLIDELHRDVEKEELTAIQKTLFQINALIAQYRLLDNNKIQCLLKNSIIYFEKRIDEMEQELPKLHHFILYGGHIIVSHIHIARAICRKVERRVVALQKMGILLGESIIYFNRLNDYFFVFARYTAKNLMVEEKYWIS